MTERHRWYADGLAFSCTGCGHCCRVEGHVWVQTDEIEALAANLAIGPDVFGRRFLRRVGNRLSLIDKASGDCIFWENGCTVYQARPRQCRTFPFWDKHLESPQTWSSAARECEGIGEGRLYDLREIAQLRRGASATSDGPEIDDLDDSPGRLTTFPE